MCLMIIVEVATKSVFNNLERAPDHRPIRINGYHGWATLMVGALTYSLLALRIGSEILVALSTVILGTIKVVEVLLARWDVLREKDGDF